jgi:hypothetical protein
MPARERPSPSQGLYDDTDFMALLELEARASTLELEPENVPVGDGLQEPGRVEVAP